MKKNWFFMARVLTIVLIFGTVFAGCTTTHHNVSISNVQNVREVFIRNAGTSNWGTNMAGNLQDIDRSKYSESVDVRVIDTQGFIYSNYNVPFDDNAFTVTSSEKYMGMGTNFLMVALAIPVLVLVLVFGGE